MITKNLMAFLLAFSFFGTGSCAENRTIQGEGESRIEACKAAKDSANLVTKLSSNPLLRSKVGPCDCSEKSSEKIGSRFRWGCIVDLEITGPGS